MKSLPFNNKKKLILDGGFGGHVADEDRPRVIFAGGVFGRGAESVWSEVGNIILRCGWRLDATCVAPQPPEEELRPASTGFRQHW